jgi:hypothetical protein
LRARGGYRGGGVDWVDIPPPSLDQKYKYFKENKTSNLIAHLLNKYIYVYMLKLN